MHAEDLLVDDGGNWEGVECLGEGFPHFDVVSALALVIKPINPIDTSALMISPQQEEILRVFNLIRQHKADRFQTLLPAIYIVPKEQIVGIWRKATILKKPEEVVVLTVHVSADFDRRF